MFPVRSCCQKVSILSKLSKRKIFLLPASNLRYRGLNYTTRRGQEKKEELELNGTHQLLVYADDVKLLGKNINATKNKT
jgi:hypothetical protein